MVYMMMAYLVLDGHFRFTRVLSLICFIFLWPTVSWGAEVYIPELKAKPGEPIEIPIMIDQVESLAGIKLVITFDAAVLTYRKGARTAQSDSLMHVVNDRNPGRLVIVMAGARGIKGKDFSIFNLTFDVKKDINEKVETKLEIREIQLMSDQLKEIAAVVKNRPLTISP